MRPAKLIDTKNIPISDIEISQRLRPVSEASVESLKQSIETLGLQDEIHVRKIKKSGKLRLIAGLHRMTVFEMLGRADIPAKIWDCTDDWADLAEIDDNLAHADLDPLELAIFLAKRKEVYERAYPETKRGAVGNAVNHGLLTDSMSVRSFATASAEKMGVSERTVFRLLAVGQSLGSNEIQQLRDAPNKVTMKDLEVIAKCGEPAVRGEICEALGNGTAKKAKEVLDRKKGPAAEAKSPAESAYQKIAGAWGRAPREARRRFVSANLDELKELIASEDGRVADVVPFPAQERGAS